MNLPRSLIGSLLVWIIPWPGVAAAVEVEAIAPSAPWRVFLVCGQQERRGRESAMTYTTPPPANWHQPDYDDSGWGRYGPDLYETIGGYGFGQSATTTVLCLRTAFGITDPAQARDLTLSLEYRGGVVVYVNGQEAGRQHLPKGQHGPNVAAEEYPAEAFTDPAGSPLPPSDRPAAKHLDRYERMIRRLSVTVPAGALRKGANVLAIAVHRAPIDKVPITGGRGGWSSAGLCDVKLTSAGGAGVAAYADALKDVMVSNATPMDTVAVTPGKRQSGFLWWGITVTPAPLTRGNPFEPLRPIRAVAPRGGTCSGQIVVSGPGPISGLKASMGPLKHAGANAAIPAEAVRVAFATQEKDEVFCNALLPQPVDGAPVQPVWVLVDVPRNQAPGWYAGTLTIALGVKSVAVPVQVLVSGWTLTDPKDNATLVCMYQSPETLALHYKVEPWSDRHFALIEKSFRSMALAGNDILLVPVILDSYLGHKNGLVRWVRKGGGFEPEYALFERYLDLHTKVFGKPRVVTLSLWKQEFGARTWFRGKKNDTVGPCMVTELDPGTGQMKPLTAPHFGEPGSEEFWKPMIEGVRRRIVARGCDDRFLLLGEPFDSRPLQPVVDFFKKIEPGMRWQIYSHYDGGEPKPKDGKFICHGGFEVGLRIDPNGSAHLPESDRDYPKVAPQEFLRAGAARCDIHYTSSPLSYRVVMRGTIARIGLDCWTVATDKRGRRASLYGCPPGEGWLWRAHVPALTAPGPDGAVRTTRGQMFLEGLQECELSIALIRTKQKASPEMAAKIAEYFGQRDKAFGVGGALPQAVISQDLGALAARGYALGAELAGERCEGDWRNPPPGSGGPR